jgi:hypothetical protein
MNNTIFGYRMMNNEELSTTADFQSKWTEDTAGTLAPNSSSVVQVEVPFLQSGGVNVPAGGDYEKGGNPLTIDDLTDTPAQVRDKISATAPATFDQSTGIIGVSGIDESKWDQTASTIEPKVGITNVHVPALECDDDVLLPAGKKYKVDGNAVAQSATAPLALDGTTGDLSFPTFTADVRSQISSVTSAIAYDQTSGQIDKGSSWTDDIRALFTALTPLSYNNLTGQFSFAGNSSFSVNVSSGTHLNLRLCDYSGTSGFSYTVGRFTVIAPDGTVQICDVYAKTSAAVSRAWNLTPGVTVRQATPLVGPNEIIARFQCGTGTYSVQFVGEKDNTVLTNPLPDGLYSAFGTLVTAFTTSELTEGSNLFFTDARAIAAARTGLSATSPAVYNSTTGDISISTSGIRSLLSATSPAVYNSTTGDISISTSGIRSLISASAPVTYNNSTGVIACTGSTYVGTVVYSDSKAVGTDAGGFTSGSYVTRTLNTQKSDTVTGTDSGITFSLSSNKITINSSGRTYMLIVEAIAPAYKVARHQIRLRKEYSSGASDDFFYGMSMYADATNNTENTSQITAPMKTPSLAGQTISLSIQHQCQTTNATNGFGVAANFASSEVYAMLTIHVYKLND